MYDAFSKVGNFRDISPFGFHRSLTGSWRAQLARPPDRIAGTAWTWTWTWTWTGWQTQLGHGPGFGLGQDCRHGLDMDLDLDRIAGTAWTWTWAWTEYEA